MITNNFGEPIFAEQDLCDFVMQGRDITAMREVLIDPDLDLQSLIANIDAPGQLLTWSQPSAEDLDIAEFDKEKQSRWHMPDSYQDLDIADYVLSLCKTQDQLQRAGKELLMYQEHDLFDLLRYLKYLVDVMRDNQVIWGVGRGSSVASYVLFLLGVHRIDSLFYDLDPHEFLR